MCLPTKRQASKSNRLIEHLFLIEKKKPYLYSGWAVMWSQGAGAVVDEFANTSDISEVNFINDKIQATAWAEADDL